MGFEITAINPYFEATLLWFALIYITININANLMQPKNIFLLVMCCTTQFQYTNISRTKMLPCVSGIWKTLTWFVFGLDQFLLLPQMPQKILFASKVTQY